MEPPICPLCGVNARERADEPGQPISYFTLCHVCTSLSGYREHTHTYYPSPAQVTAGTYEAGHSWRTAVSVRPLWEGGAHIGFRCTEFDRCGWERRFDAFELEPCDVHTGALGRPVPSGVCRMHPDHRPGEFDGRGHITEYGRQRERERQDAANWDPGRYIEREA